MDQWEISQQFEKLIEFYDQSHQNPALEYSDELKLFKQLPNSQDRIAEANMTIVADFANAYFIRFGLETNLVVEDLIHAGITGLLMAISHFDTIKAKSHNWRFADYAKWWVRKYMGEYIDQLDK